MSDIPRTGRPVTAAGGGTTRGGTDAGSGVRVVREAYSFVCLRCGHGWEQSYAIEHHVDALGRENVVYRTDGREVPSPLTRPTCDHCDGHVIRIMRPGRVSTVLDSMHARRPGGSTRAPRETGRSREQEARGDGSGGTGRRLWHVPHLLRVLHLQRRTH